MAVTTRPAEVPVPLAGVPDGLFAHPIYRYRSAGEGEVAVRSRRGHHRVRRVALRGSGADGDRAVGPDRAFVLSADQRRWAAVEAHFGAAAWERSTELAASGVLDLICAVDGQLRLGQPEGWELRPQWKAVRAGHLANRTRAREEWSAAAAALADRVSSRWPDLAAALSSAAGRPIGARLEALVFAAEDLVEGVRHDGPRAFSQAHWGSTKARGRVADTLLAAGLLEGTLVELGLSRSKYIGLSGFRAWVGGVEVQLQALRGPVLLRCDQRSLRVALDAGLRDVVIVENLQAAESLCDHGVDVGVIYTAGVLSGGGLSLIGAAAGGANHVAVVPDADLGGVRIAEQLLSAVPNADVLDIGAEAHPPRERFEPGGVSDHGLRAAVGGAAGALALAVLERGYPVEQELATAAAVQRWMEGLK